MNIVRLVSVACCLVLFSALSHVSAQEKSSWKISSLSGSPKQANRVTPIANRLLKGVNSARGGWVVSADKPKAKSGGSHFESKQSAAPQASNLGNSEVATFEEVEGPAFNKTIIEDSNFSWAGAISLKNNYVFSTGTEIDDRPVGQLWVRGTMDNGFFVDVWSNFALDPDNPNRSHEIDYSIGYTKSHDWLGEFTAMLSYYDIQTPDLFSFNNDVVGASLSWRKGRFNVDALYFAVDGGRNGYRIANSWGRSISDTLTMQMSLNLANGPYSRRKAVIGKAKLGYYNASNWLESVGLELSEILYAQDEDDPRGFAATFYLSKDLF